MDTRMRGAVFKSVSLLFVLASAYSCSDKKIEERLKSLSGNEYLALSQKEKATLSKNRWIVIRLGNSGSGRIYATTF
jgi:hypothetical protein